MAFPDITPDLKAAMPDLRGRLLANQSLAELTWFRVGGPAQVLFSPADEDDLAYFRREHEFRSAHVFEQPNGDFAVTIARQLVVSYYQFELYRRLVARKALAVAPAPV